MRQLHVLHCFLKVLRLYYASVSFMFFTAFSWFLRLYPVAMARLLSLSSFLFSSKRRLDLRSPLLDCKGFPFPIVVSMPDSDVSEQRTLPNTPVSSPEPEPDAAEPPASACTPPGDIMRVAFPSTVRTITQTLKYQPSFLRSVFQNPDSRRVHRLPWMTDYHPEYVELVKVSAELQNALFDSSALRASLLDEDHETCCIDLYFYDRFIMSKGEEDQRSSPGEHLVAWNRFVRKFNRNPIEWLSRLRLNESAFFSDNSSTAIMMKIHCICTEHKRPCAVDTKYKCPMCYTSSPKRPALQSPTEPDVLLDAVTLLDAIMNVDIAFISTQLSEIQNNERKRDFRLFRIEQTLRSSQSASPPPSQKQKN
jgi:hypothetical protein